MKRLSLIGSWKRIGVQLGLLAGVGLAFVGGSEPPTVDAAPVPCQKEGNCTFKKPLFGIILDNSSSMNEQFDANTTRWEGAVAAITSAIDFDNGYIAENFILGLIRFGHDPDPNVAGTKIAADTSGLVDGQKLDVPWYDDQAPNKPYIECTNGDAIIAALEERVLVLVAEVVAADEVDLGLAVVELRGPLQRRVIGAVAVLEQDRKSVV